VCDDDHNDELHYTMLTLSVLYFYNIFLSDAVFIYFLCERNEEKKEKKTVL